MEAWELNELKKRYLNGYKDAEKREKRIMEEIQQLRLDTMFQSLQNDGMPKGSRRQQDLSDYMSRYDELMDDLLKEKTEAITKKQEIRNAISRMEDEDEIDVLVRKYILKQTWGEIAKALSYTERNVLYIHGKALKHFEIPETFHSISY